MVDKILRSPKLFLDGQKSLKVSKALQKKKPKTHTQKKWRFFYTFHLLYIFYIQSNLSLSLLPTENPHGGESELHEDD